jgi:peptidoglycan/xylan/chitin deacetylase (PgdA/CDA1 family)
VIEGRRKTLAFAALDALGITSLWARLARGVPILAYHGVTARPDDRLRNRRRLHVPVERFVEHLRELSQKWRPLSLRELIEALRDGRPLPPRSVIVTFDDGYRNTRTVAAPLLARFGVPFSLFVLTEPRGRRLWMDRLEAALLSSRSRRLEWRGVPMELEDAAGRERALRRLAGVLQPLGDDRPGALSEIVERLGGEPDEDDDDRDLLGWDEIRDLHASGIDVGAHSDRHEPLTRRAEAEVAEALAGCRRTLEAELGPGAYPFCYPYGAWDPPRAAAVRAAGFTCALTTDPGRNRIDEDPFSLRRFLIGADDDVARLRASLSGLRALAQSGGR